MALTHEQLYQSGDLSRIDFYGYVKSLTANLLQPRVAGNTIKLNIDVSKILLGIDLAIPCGLIINELVSNSLKYSFPGDCTGTITVSLRGEGRDYTLVVSDYGWGCQGTSTTAKAARPAFSS